MLQGGGRIREKILNKNIKYKMGNLILIINFKKVELGLTHEWSGV
jgi:hypothetical protein